MKKQAEKPALVVFKEESVRLRNEMEAERDPDKKRRFRFNLKSAKFWERLLEGLVFVLVLVILSGGCAKVMQGTGLIFEGVGDGVVAGGQHLQESASK